MVESKEVRHGFKYTKLGWIPEDWNFDKSEKATKYFGGAAFKSTDASPYGVRWLKIANVGINKVKWEEKSYLPGHFQIDYARYLLKQEEIVMALTRPILNGQLKITKLEKNDVPALLNQRVARVEVKEGYDSGFIYYLLQTPYFVNLMEAAMAGTDPPNIGSTELGRIKIPLPPLPEQQKIAQILSTWDQAINKTEQLIRKKQQRKKGLMQQLLTGKKRFTEFVRSNKMRETKMGRIPEDWELKKVSEVFEFLPTNSYSRKQMNYEVSESSVYNIHYGDIHATYNEPILDFDIQNTIPVLSTEIKISYSASNLKDGDVIVADASEDYEGIGEAIEIVNVKDRKVVAGLHTFALRDKNSFTSVGFRAYIFKNPKVSKAIKVIATGSKVFGISKTNLEKFELVLPTAKEQQKIAFLFSVADKEISTLQSQLVKLQKQKKGLMQKLLTGEIRTIS